MIIKGLMVEGIGRFTAAAQVDDFDDGLNVLAAGNEAGKSTLFRAIRTCLFARHDSRNQEIKDLASDDSELPATVQLTFRHKERNYVIKKCFLRSPSAVLFEDGREIARSKQADEVVWELLGLNPGGGRTLDDGAFGVLWVGQRESLGVPTPSPGASSALNAAIESEVGTLIGGERARKVLDDIVVELRRFLTDSDRPKSDGPLHRALANVDRWKTSESEAQNKLAALDQQFATLFGLRQQHHELTNPVTGEQWAAELVEARNSLIEAQVSVQDIRRLEAEESSAKRALENTTQRLKQFRERVSRIDTNRKNEKYSLIKLSEQQAREQEVRALLLRTQDQFADVEREAQSLATRERQLGKLSAASLRAIRKDEISRQLKAIERAAGELLQIEAQLAQIKIKPKMVDELDELDRQIASLDAQLSAAAAQLTVEVKPAGAGKIRIGADQLKGTHSAPVIAPTMITVGELAVITVMPAPSARQEKRQSLEAERVSMLQSIGIANVSEAHALLSKRRDLEASRKGILAELKSLNVNGDPAPNIAKMKSELASTDAEIMAALQDSKRQKLPSNKEIEAEKLELARQRNGLDARRGSLEEARKQQQKTLESAVEGRSGSESQIALMRKNIADDVALCPDAERATQDATVVNEVMTAERAHQTAAIALSAKRQIAPDVAEIERREARCRRLEQALENRKNDLIQLEREMGRLTGQIQAAGGDGIGEILAAAKDQRALAERECRRIQERVSNLQLLRDTIAACLTEGRERYYEPVRRHLRPFLNDLFPRAELDLGEDFAITGIKRDRPEVFTRLSDGTQEQIAVLVRLAMASLLAERGHAVPVILDDALVYCDDDRIKRMFDALSRAGRHQQVIVLTCRLRSFAPLGGHILRVQNSVNTGAQK